MPYREVARLVRAAVSSVARWRQAYRRDRRNGSRARPTLGCARLTETEKARLRRLLLQGARAAGDTTSCGRSAHRHADRGGVRRALQSGRRMEALAARPALELAETRTARAPAGRGGHRTLGDAHVAGYKKTPPDVVLTSRFSMKAVSCRSERAEDLGAGGVYATGAPSYTRDKLSAISALSVSPQRARAGLVHARSSREHYRGGGRGVSAPPPAAPPRTGRAVLDGGMIHRRADVTAFLTRHTRLHVHRFLAYAPELNPDESRLDQVQARPGQWRTEHLRQLDAHLRRLFRRVHGSQPLWWSCILASDLPWM